jgi:hypothetical protein
MIILTDEGNHQAETKSVLDSVRAWQENAAQVEERSQEREARVVVLPGASSDALSDVNATQLMGLFD